MPTAAAAAMALAANPGSVYWLWTSPVAGSGERAGPVRATRARVLPARLGRAPGFAGAGDGEGRDPGGGAGPAGAGAGDRRPGPVGARRGSAGRPA